MAKMYRTSESFVSKDPEKREKQLANLRNRHKTKTVPLFEDAPAKSFHVADFKHDISGFADEHYFLPERKRVVLLDWQVDLFKDLFDPPEKDRATLALLGMPKKSGKSTIAGIVALWYLLVKPYAECYLMGPDLQQGQLVIFDKVCKAIQLHPQFRDRFKIGADVIRNKLNGATLRVLPCNKTAAGLNPDLVIFDELWQFGSVEAMKAIDEMTNVPGKHSLILVVTYAGYQSEESGHLWRWYKQGIDQEAGLVEPDDKFYFVWRRDYTGIPWVTEKYLETQKKRLRESAYKRFHENQWTSGEESFVDARTIELCTSSEHKQGQIRCPVVVGLDVGYKHDASALAAVGKLDSGKLALIDHAVFVPGENETVDLEATFENALLEWFLKYTIVEIRFDPYQAIRSAQTLLKQGLPMSEFQQTVANLCKICEVLQGLLKSQNIVLYESAEVRRNLLAAAVKESSRGWRIVKQSQSKKIDLTIALAMAAQGAVELLLPTVPAGLQVIGDYLGDELLMPNYDCFGQYQGSSRYTGLDGIFDG